MQVTQHAHGRPVGQRQVCIDMNVIMHARMMEAAKKASMPLPRYAASLLEAAWAARSGKSLGDGDLDAWVGACVALYGANKPEDEIARVLGCSRRVVNKILDAWRRVLNETGAAQAVPPGKAVGEPAPP
jgi:hypothetical protein